MRLSSKQKLIAKQANPRNKITGADFKKIRSKKKKKNGKKGKSA